MKQEIAQKILDETRANYEQLSEAWDRTRQFANDFEMFQPYIKAGDRVLDVGCGNARLLKMLESVNVNYVGVDNSPAMLDTAKKNFPAATFQVADILSLPFADNSFDVVFCMSTLHHVPSNTLREQAMGELARVTRPGGLVIIANWHYRSPHFYRSLFKNFIKKIVGMSDLDFGDVFVPWSSTNIQRYVHLFSHRGIQRLAHNHGLATVRCIISANTSRGYRNLVFIGKKS